MIALLAVGAVTLGTLGIGAWGIRLARTTSDLLVASRAVSPWWNAAAISGEYLSAASFLGIAGLELKLGVSALWQSLGFTAGYLALLLFVAAPLRRFGSYTIPDFAEARLRSPRLRSLASAIVLLIGGFYLLPQLKGAGIALAVVTGAPYWVGVAAVAMIVTAAVAFGGMRGITYVQAFQFWIKVFAISVPACLLLIHFGGLPGRAALFGQALPRAGAHGFVVHLTAPQRVQFPQAGAVILAGRRVAEPAGAHVRLPAGSVGIPPRGIVPVADGITAQSRQPLVAPGWRRGQRQLATARLLAAGGDVPGDDGAAAHPRPLLHQPRRARRPSYDRPRDQPPRPVLRIPRRSTARSGGSSCPSSTSPDRPTPSCCACRRSPGRGPWARSSAR